MSIRSAEQQRGDPCIRKQRVRWYVLLVVLIVLTSSTPLSVPQSDEPAEPSERIPFDTELTATGSPSEAVVAVLERVASCNVDWVRGAVDFTPHIGVLAGYRRFENTDPLENRHRAELYEYITTAPGAYVSELSEKTRIHRSTVRYHLRILEAEGLIFERRMWGKHRLYPVASADPELIAAREGDTVANLLVTLTRMEPATVTDLAAELDRSPSTISYHLSRLAEQGLVERARDGNAVLTRLVPHVSATLRSEDQETDHSETRTDVDRGRRDRTRPR